MHIVWYDYVVYLINMVVVDGYVLSWRQAINSIDDGCQSPHDRRGSV